MSTDEEGFVELEPIAKFTAKASALIVSVSQMRNGPPRLILNFSEELFAKLGDGARIRMAWKQESFTLRIVAVNDGPFEPSKTRLGRRYVVRLPLPDGVRPEKGLKEPCPHKWLDKILYCTVPPPMRIPPPRVDPVAAARAAVPTPNFSGPKRAP